MVQLLTTSSPAYYERTRALSTLVHRYLQDLLRPCEPRPPCDAALTGVLDGVTDAHRVELLGREEALVGIVVLVARELREREAREQRRLRALVRWCVGALVRWCVGALVRWCVGALVRWFVVLLAVRAGSAGRLYSAPDI